MGASHDLSIFAYLGDSTQLLARGVVQLSGRPWKECCITLLQEELDWWLRAEEEYKRGIIPDEPDDEVPDDLPTLRTPEDRLRYASRQIKGLRQRLEELAEPDGSRRTVDFQEWWGRAMVRPGDVATDSGAGGELHNHG